MDLTLDASETRVLGALIEKEITTPEYYPLTLNALVAACNQKSNRSPVVNWTEDTVAGAVERLRAKGLCLETTGGGNRVPKYSQRFSDVLNLGRREVAVLCELMLRGAQTPGELRSRAERMHAFTDLEEVEHTLQRMIEHQPPLVARLERQPGTREQRYAELLSRGGDLPQLAEPTSAPAPARANSEQDRPLQDRLVKVETELRQLRSEFDALQRRFDDWQRQLR